MLILFTYFQLRRLSISTLDMFKEKKNFVPQLTFYILESSLLFYFRTCSFKQICFALKGYPYSANITTSLYEEKTAFKTSN